MSIKFTTLLAVLIALLACARAQAERRHKLTRPVHRFAPNRPYLAGKRIVGGFVINISDAPYQVSLQYDDDHNCGGAILSSKWILTAAHCINDNAPSKPTVRVGSSEHASGGTVVRVARIVPHPMHDSQNNYDIALLELKNELTFSEKVQPIALPEQDDPIEEGTMGIVSGWGLTLSEADSNDVLRATNVPTVNQQECNKAYQSRYGGITPQMFCAGYKQGGQDTCRQDSGGPFVAEGKLIGVISWGHECALAGYPGVYARVASVRDWIRTTSGV